MNIISFLLGGFIAYWFYGSIKREGFYWLPKIFLLAGSFFLLFISLVTYQHELNLLLRFFSGNRFVVRAMCLMITRINRIVLLIIRTTDSIF